MDVFSTVETAVVAAINPLLVAGTIRQLEALPTAAMDVGELVPMIIRILPGVFITMSNLDNDHENEFDLISCDIDIIIAAKNLRSKADMQAGVFDISQDVFGLIHDTLHVGAGWSKAILQSASLVAWSQVEGIALFGQKYSINGYL